MLSDREIAFAVFVLLCTHALVFIVTCIGWQHTIRKAAQPGCGLRLDHNERYLVSRLP